MQNRSFICNRSAVQYNDLMKSWISMYKFRGHERYAPLLTVLLIQAFQAMREEIDSIMAKEPPALVAHSATPAQNPVDVLAHPPYTHTSIRVCAHEPDPCAKANAHIQTLALHATTNARAEQEAATRRHPSLPTPKKPQWRPDAVTYVPVSGERLAERGFNQAERLAAGLASATRLPIVDLLQRQINTTKQSFKSRAERIETMKNAFSIQVEGFALIEELWSNRLHHDTSMPIQSIQLLLIDDIYTTGSTLDACGQVTLHAARSAQIPIEIYTLTLARS